jgi:hypothetical protein
MVLSLIVGSLALGAAVLTGIVGYWIDRNADAEESAAGFAQDAPHTSEMDLRAGERR